jgi:phosphate transport system regulatory protein PhoU
MATHLETELYKLKQELFEMWDLVLSQVKTAQESIRDFDKGAAAEVLFKEKMVDVFELRLDRDCENIIALYSPVAVDLRLTLATLKINTNLERIADFAKGIAKYVAKSPREKINPELLKVTELDDLLQNVYTMLSDARKALEMENSRKAVSIFAKDDLLDDMHKRSNDIISGYIRSHPDELDESLNVHSIIRKIERMGDHTSNIAEEIVFYLEAKVLKHSGIDKTKRTPPKVK